MRPTRRGRHAATPPQGARRTVRPILRWPPTGEDQSIGTTDVVRVCCYTYGQLRHCRSVHANALIEFARLLLVA